MATSENPADSHPFTARRITFIGGGNMGAALARGLLGKGWSADRIRVVEPAAQRRTWLTENLGVATFTDANAALADADAIVLAVKPQHMQAALAPLTITRPLLVLSIAAGVRLASLREWLGPAATLVRCMPNTPALVGAGAAALCTDPATPADARHLAQAIMSAAGTCCWVEDEAQLDTVTALSGSGPAYFFLLAECMQQAATALGLPAATAAALARQTLVGAGQLVAADPAELATLRERVTSKGGTTAAALEAFRADGFAVLVAHAIEAAAQRSFELGAPAAP
ncbi:MAG: pyrroline-5-carboxylate reductase [Nevskiaceae bacterium]|nr:MAG: pyrroline-5-carboxylate reductase [Nevskiaceae bacterium]TBR75106.1 MAG: pyrroline-5-carboxylate reductase [Nevskiaceae bacterium]